ncbi:MAG: DUF1385 domain-containing protein [Sandaracinaceae bacterium]|nr:DUF1385 domain-containing protein [Sandaracinaceae bacterium]
MSVNKQAVTEPQKPYIGGQAVIEGVMMRAPSCVTVAVRRPDGAIVVSEEPVTSKVARSPLLKLPLVRGVATLVESMSIGYRALRFSAEQQEVSVATLMLAIVLGAEGSGRSDSGKSDSKGRGAFALSLLIAVGLFVVLPQGATAAVNHWLGLGLTPQHWHFHAMTGGFKLLILSGYLAFLSSMPDVRRVFQYHGAEHKTIYAYEKGLPLTVANVQAQSTLHPRCGTTFLILVVFVSVVLGAVVTPLFVPTAQGLEGNLLTLLVRIALLIPIAAVSYELQRISARYFTKGPLRVFLWPGFLFQKITTRAPEDAQVEIAIAAMESAIGYEDDPVEGGVETFDSFDDFQRAYS